MFKSDLIPTRWAVYVTYSSSTSSFTRLLAAPRSSWYEARDAWHKFFFQHTGKEWDNRNDGTETPDRQAFRYVRTRSELEYERFWHENKTRSAQLAEIDRAENNERFLAKVYEQEAQDRATRLTRANAAKAAAMAELSRTIVAAKNAASANAPTYAGPVGTVGCYGIRGDAEQAHRGMSQAVSMLQATLEAQVEDQDRKISSSTRPSTGPSSCGEQEAATRAAQLSLEASISQ